MSKRDRKPQDGTSEPREAAPAEAPRDAAPADGVEAEGPRDEGEGATAVDAEVAAALARQAEEWNERHLRLLAEYDNFRRRVQREKEQWTEEALERFATDLLAVLDNFEKALAAREGDPQAVIAGVELTDRQLRGVLQRYGVEVVDPVGQPFDPRYHEALLRAPSAGSEPGTVLSVLEKGYTMKGRLLRPARVQVAAAPEA